MLSLVEGTYSGYRNDSFGISTVVFLSYNSEKIATLTRFKIPEIL